MIKRTKQQMMEIFFIIVLGSCIAFLPNILNLIFVMAITPYIYKTKYFLFFMMLQLCHLFVDKNGTYLLIIYFVGSLVFASFVKLIQGNLKISMLFFQLSSCLIFSFYPTYQLSIFLLMISMQLILFFEKEEKNVILAIFIGAIGFLLSYLMIFNPTIVLIISLLFICISTNILLSCMMFFIYDLFFGFSPFWFIVMILFTQFIKSLFIYYKEKKTISIYPIKINQNYIYQQLSHFSDIFENLGIYYENQSNIQSLFLKSMSYALNYTSRKCGLHRNDNFIMRREIYNCIEDVGYEIESIECELLESGYYQIVCELKAITSKDIDKIMHALDKLVIKFEFVEVKRKSWNDKSRRLVIKTVPQMQIEASTEGCFIHEESGDTTALFQHEQIYYCVLSDGMGSGKEAHRLSKCVGEIFQKMILSNIHLLEVMGCMNQLLQGDSYATCDVCAFDIVRKSVMVCKSAASPTYLIRNHELYAIWGNSLPIGIVAHIDVDHIHVQVEHGDWFIMSSDGVGLDEIKTWMQGISDLSVKQETKRFKRLLLTRQRNDDSTVLIAKVV